MRESCKSGARARVDDAHARVTCEQDEGAARRDSEIIARFFDRQRVGNVD